jgi:ring-1,2-phenylacetyl-CoA epoxidase subunit PaaD
VSAPAEEARVWNALEDVADPELPVLSVVDLGIVVDVAVQEGAARVRFTPTFIGCPAIEQMRSAIADAVRACGLEPDVEVTYDEIWTSRRITDQGRRRLAEAGIAPPGDLPVRGGLAIALRPVATCPHCGSSETRRENAFGPTACRAIWYCDGCGQPFEAFKDV